MNKKTRIDSITPHAKELIKTCVLDFVPLGKQEMPDDIPKHVPVIAMVGGVVQGKSVPIPGHFVYDVNDGALFCAMTASGELEIMLARVMSYARLPDLSTWIKTID